MGKTGQNPFVFADFAQRCFRCAAPCRRAVGLGADCDAARAQKSEDVSLIILQKLGLLQNELAIEVYTKGTGTTGRKPPRKLRWLPWRENLSAIFWEQAILQQAHLERVWLTVPYKLCIKVSKTERSFPMRFPPVFSSFQA